MQIFLDFDGTLIDISERYYQVYLDAINKLHGHPITKIKYWTLKRDRINTTEILKMSKLDDTYKDNFDKIFIKNIESKKYLNFDIIFPFVNLVIDKLIKDRHQIYLISSRMNISNALWEIKKLKILKKFHAIRIGRKNKEGYITKVEFIKELILPGKKIMVGDTEDDIFSAQKLNMISIGVLSGIRNQARLQQIKPDFIVDNMMDVLNIIK